MILFALLLSLAIDRLWDNIAAKRSFAWFTRYCSSLRRSLGPAQWREGPLGLLLVLLFPLLAVMLIQQLLAGLSSLLVFLFAVAVLVYSLGPRDLDSDVQRYVNAREQSDQTEAWAIAREIDDELAAPTDPSVLDRLAIEAILVAAHDRILGVIFWFVVFGPFGALMFRLICILKAQTRGEEPTSGFARVAEITYAVLAWAPSRLTALNYALVGSFADALYRWREETLHNPTGWRLRNRLVLVASGLGALQLGNDPLELTKTFSTLQVRTALAMVWRSVILVLVLLAIATLGSAVY